MVLQASVRQQIHHLLHKIKAGLNGTIGRVRHNFFPYSLVLIPFYTTSVLLLSVLFRTCSPNPRQSNTARSSSVSMHWDILMTNWLIQFLLWWSRQVSSLHLVRHLLKLASHFHSFWFSLWSNDQYRQSVLGCRTCQEYRCNQQGNGQESWVGRLCPWSYPSVLQCK